MTVEFVVNFHGWLKGKFNQVKEETEKYQKSLQNKFTQILLPLKIEIPTVNRIYAE